MKTSYRHILVFFRRYIGPSLAQNKGRIAISLLLLFLSTGLFILAMELSRLVIQGVQQTLDGGPVERLLAGVFGPTPAGQLAGIGLACLATFTAASAVAFARDICFEEIALRLTVSLRKTLFAQLLATRIPALREFESSLLVKRLIGDLASIRTILVEALMLRSADAALFAGLLAYLFSLDVALTLVSLGLIALYFIAAEVSARMIGPGLYRSDMSTEDMTAHLNQAFQRVLDIKANQTEAQEARRFGALADADYRVRRQTIKLLMLDRSVTGWLSAILPISVTLVGGFWVLRGSMQLDAVLVFVAAINMLTHAVDKLTQIPMIVSRTAVAVHNVEALFQLPPERLRIPGEGQPDAAAPIIAAHGFRRRLSQGHWLQIDGFELRPGEKVAIIGPSGCGKSSLFASLLKFDEDYLGSLRLMGMEVGATGVEAIRSRLAYMQQHSMVLPEDVAANVHYARTGPQDTAAIRRMLRLVDLQDLLDEDQPRDTDRLSGGQKRRLCLARALYRNAPLLLLDEPLTGVSPMASKAIVQALVRRPEALVMVTHQYEDLHQFDRVILLEIVETPDGRVTRIAAQDRHETLAQSSPAYRAALAHG